LSKLFVFISFLSWKACWKALFCMLFNPKSRNKSGDLVNLTRIANPNLRPFLSRCLTLTN
jgi:hypothetical protein